MADIATLALKVDATQVKSAEKSLDSLTQSGKDAEKSTLGLGRAFAALGGIAIAKQAADMADGYTKLTAQMKNATTSAADYAAAMSNVERIASVAQVDIDTVSKLYSRLAQSAKEAGISQQQVADISETVALGLKVNGASAGEASSAMLQLSQAFGSGVLRGEEFNAMMESAPNLMRALASSMNVPIGQLRTMAADGEITTDKLVKAFTDEKLKASLSEQAANVQTISGAFVELGNQVMLATGIMAKETGATSTASSAIASLTERVKLLRFEFEHGDWVDKLLALSGVTGVYKAFGIDPSVISSATERGKSNQVSDGKIKRPSDGNLGASFGFVTGKELEEQNKKAEKAAKDHARERERIQQESDDAIRTMYLDSVQIMADNDPTFKAALAWDELSAKVQAGFLDAETAGKEYAKQMDFVLEEERAAKKDMDKFLADLEKHAKDRRIDREDETAKEIADKQEKELKRQQRAWEGFTGNVARNMGDVLFKGAADGFNDMGDAFKNLTLRMAADAAAANLTQYLFGSEKGGGALGAFGASVMSFFPSFAGGGSTGIGSRSGGVDGMGGFPAILHPNETVIDHSAGKTASQPSVTVVQNINIDSRSDQATIMAAMQRSAQMAETSIMNSLQRGGAFARAVGRA